MVWTRGKAWRGWFLAALVLASSGAAASPRAVGAAEAAALIQAGQGREDFVLLDLRTPAEFGDERLEGAVLVDFLAPGFRDEVARLDRSKTYLVYCRTGNRSGKALAVFDTLAFRDVIHLAAGIVGWKEAGLPTVRGVGR